MRLFLKYTLVLVAVYLAAWTAAYAIMLMSRGDGLDFRNFAEYLWLGWTFKGGELPTFIWIFSMIAFLPLAGLAVFFLRRYERHKTVA